MTIEKGAEWGSVVAKRDEGVEPRGDLARDLGVGDVSGHAGPWLRLPLDAIAARVVCADGSEHRVTTTGWVWCGHRLRGDLVIVSSTAFVDGRRIFSRAHPNDGRLDWMRIEPTMPIRQRMSFWRRTRTETHLPHPLVRTGAGKDHEFTFGRPKNLITSDGDRLRGVVDLEVRVVPDATTTHIPSL